MRPRGINDWLTLLRRIAQPAVATDLSLGLGALESPFRAAVLGDPLEPEGETASAGEIRLWRARCDPGLDVDSAISAPTDGSLLPRDMFRTIEVWTDAELSALHALWWLARIRRREDWSQRLVEVREWHLQHTQPDNATNRPWALHVFLLGKTAECTHYAETLLHNAMTQSGRPDPLSALILLDAAAAIDLAGTDGET